MLKRPCSGRSLDRSGGRPSATAGQPNSRRGRALFSRIIAEMNSSFRAVQGAGFRRLAQRAFNLEDADELAEFLKGDTKELTVPGSARKVRFDALQRVGVGLSRLGTSEATAIGAYEFAVKRLGE